MSKLSIKDLKDLANEIELAANHKERTIESISNKKVKEYMKTKSDKLIVNGVTKKVLSGAAGAATYSAITGALAPTVAAPILAPTAAVIAGPIVAPIPIIGPAILAVSGALSVGLITNMIMGKNQKKELEELSLDLESKQKIITSKIEKEALKLAEKYGEDVDFNERYKYLMAVIAANEELKKIRI